MAKKKKSSKKVAAKKTVSRKTTPVKKVAAKKAASKKKIKSSKKTTPKKNSRNIKKTSLNLASAKSQGARLVKNAKKVAVESLRALNQEDPTASLVMKRIRDALSPTHFSLKNYSEAHKKHSEFKKSGGGHYAVHVVSEVFEGLDLKSRQQWVLNLLKDQIGKTVHAIQMELRAPSEVPLLKDSGAPLRRDLKVKLDRPNLPRKPKETSPVEELDTMEDTDTDSNTDADAPDNEAYSSEEESDSTTDEPS